jgi:hypothetical protein
MGALCAKVDTGPSVLELIEEKLKQISTIYPVSLPVCLLGESGELVSELTALKHTSQEMGRNMASMKRAANQFARSIDPKQAECSTLHVKGADNIFSLYVFDKIVLAFYSQIPTEDEESPKLDFVSKDKQIQTEVIDGPGGIRSLVRSLANV